jgi:NAD(P)-dependent dehydrogenase (short-subunit alcohol dehydrogenase family)
VSGEGQDATPAQQTKAIITQNGGSAEISAESVATWASAQKIVQAAMDHFGRIDIVVNNAGILRDRLFFNMSVEEWHAVIDVHLHVTFYVSRAAAPHFKTQQSGAYVHMTSTSGLIGNLGQANYGAAKLGIVALSRAIAGDMKRYNVRSNCISPFAWSRMIGSIPTETPEQQARVAKLQKLDTAQIAPMAAFLASDAAADVTAQIFAVRGNEIFLMSQPRPVRGMHTSEGWTPETIAQRVLPAMKPNFFPLENSNIVFSWDPV